MILGTVTIVIALCLIFKDVSRRPRVAVGMSSDDFVEMCLDAMDGRDASRKT